MPINVFPDLTRRQWLRGSLAAAGAGVISSARAAQGGGEEFWALLSDTHIAADANKEARGVNMAANLERCVAQVLRAGGKPHGVLIGGDCALNDGQPADYTTFVERLRPFHDTRVQVHCVLGNHDNRQSFLNICGETGVDPLLRGWHVSVLSSARVNWVLLDSLEHVNVTPGLLGPEQLSWLRRTLRQLPDKPTLVMVHHNPQTEVQEGKKLTGLKDTAALMEVLKAEPRVKALFFGHTHRWSAVPPAEGLPWLINLPPVSYVFDAAQPAGWVAARVRGETLELEMLALNVNHAAHRQKVEIAI
ncbi:MAG: metallophosphoesterase [Verrucomicrobiales bacterium]|nr:metallophosphoesterase [Verrucomicrobiales bacterium]